MKRKVEGIENEREEKERVKDVVCNVVLSIAWVSDNQVD